MTLLWMAILLAVSACAFGQEAPKAQVQLVATEAAKSEVVKKAEELEKTAKEHTASGKHVDALVLRQEALSLLENTYGIDDIANVGALNNVAESYSWLAQWGKAVALETRVIKIRENILGYEHPQTALGLSKLARTYRTLAWLDKALALDLRSVAILENILGADHQDTAISLQGLALTYLTLGELEAALRLQIRSLAILKKRFWPNQLDTAFALNNLAHTYVLLGQYDNGVKLSLEALAIRERILGAEHPDTAFSLQTLSVAFVRFSQLDKALPLALRALAIRERFLGSEHPDTALALDGLALTYQALDQFDNALPLQLRSLAIRERTLGPEHPYTAVALSNLTSTYIFLAKPSEALPLQIRALEILEKILGSEHIATALALNNLAVTYRALGYGDKAFPLQLRSLTITLRVLGPENPWTALRSINLALHYEDVGEVETGIILFKMAINAYQASRELVSRIGRTELRNYSDSLLSRYQHLAALLTYQGRLSEAQQVLDMLKEDEQFEFIRRASDADPRSSRIGYTGAEQAWLKRYREIADQLGKLGAEERELAKQAKLGLSSEQKQRQQAIAADLKVAQTAFQSFLSEMREGLAQKGEARKVEVEEVSAQAMRESQSLIKGLGEDVALLQYYITDKRVGMLLTTPGIQLARSSTIDSKELNRKIGELRRLLQDPKSNPVAAAQELYRILVAPVSKDLEQANAKTVMLSLDGALRYLPFSALHDGKQYLVDRWNLPMYTSVTRNKLRDTVSPQWQAAGLGVTKAWPEFKPLAGVQAEMGAIVKTAAGGFMPGEVYLDEAFTASRLKDVGQRKFSLMHVASHFRFSPGTEVNSFLLLGDGERLTLGDIRTQNYRFDNVELLTLSACDTGLGGGRDEQGKEIEGFGVIAQQQGAKAVLATLWPVADESTATLMADMYRRRQSDSLTKIEALRQAQIAMRVRTKYAHPYYWAPFILMGNWK